MALLVIAYPELSGTDFELIQNYRKDHDELFYQIVKPHFTFVFPVNDLSIADFSNDIKQNIVNIQAIRFTLRCAVINKDAFNDYYHTFLVPDEGYSKIVKLHDKLYSNQLNPHHRLDIDYIPHIGIGNSKNKLICKKMVDEWNTKEFEINGIIKMVDIVKYENNTISTIEKINFKSKQETS